MRHIKLVVLCATSGGRDLSPKQLPMPDSAQQLYALHKLISRSCTANHGSSAIQHSRESICSNCNMNNTQTDCLHKLHTSRPVQQQCCCCHAQMHNVSRTVQSNSPDSFQPYVLITKHSTDPNSSTTGSTLRATQCTYQFQHAITLKSNHSQTAQSNVTCHSPHQHPVPRIRQLAAPSSLLIFDPVLRLACSQYAGAISRTWQPPCS